MSLLLTHEERRRFAGYCEREALSLKGIADQMEKINVPEQMRRHQMARATAYALVARELNSTEVMEVSSGGIGKAPEPVEKRGAFLAIGFDEMVKHGLNSGASLVNGMPWSFRYQELAVTHENDKCYIVNDGSVDGVRLTPDNLIVRVVDGTWTSCMRREFDDRFFIVPVKR